MASVTYRWRCRLCDAAGETGEVPDDAWADFVVALLNEAHRTANRTKGCLGGFDTMTTVQITEPTRSHTSPASEDFGSTSTNPSASWLWVLLVSALSFLAGVGFAEWTR